MTDTKILENPDKKFALFLLAIMFSYAFFQDTCLNSISQQFLSEYSLSPYELSALSSGFLIAAGIFFLISGFAIEKYSFNKIIINASMFSVLGAGIFVITTSFPILLIGRLLSGISYSFSFVLCMRFVAEHYYKYFAVIMGLISALVIFFGMISQSPFVILVDHIGIRNAFIINFIFGLGIFFSVVINQKKYKLNFNLENAKTLKNMLYKYRDIKIYLCSSFACLMNVPILILGGLWGNLYLVQAQQISRGMSGVILSLMFIGLMIGCPSIGWISQRLRSRKRVIVFCSGFMVILSLLITLNHNYSLESLVFIFLLMGFLSSAQTLVYPEMLYTESLSKFTLAIGVMTFLIMLLSSGLHFLFAGLLGEYQGDMNSSLNFYRSIMLMPISAVLAFIVSLFI